MSLNQVNLIGRLGQDPELAKTNNDHAYCRLSIATGRKWKNKQTGEMQEETEWHRVTVWGKQAEHCSNYLKKGRQVHVQGRLRTSSYEKDGEKRYSTEIVAQDVLFLGDRGDYDQGSNDNSGNNSNNRQQNNGNGGNNGGNNGGWDNNSSFGDDDIPF